MIKKNYSQRVQSLLTLYLLPKALPISPLGNFGRG